AFWGIPGVFWGVPGVSRASPSSPPPPQVASESPLEPKASTPRGDGQHTWPRRRRHSSHFPVCSFCCNCCNNPGCGFCCRT
ncbi:HEPC protein, partial [Vireo altiloquus]|nr:HEPC protein [Vireo altiloquus]